MRDKSLLYSNLLGSCSDRGHENLQIPTRLRQIDKLTNISFDVLLRFVPKMSTNPWPARPSPRKKKQTTSFAVIDVAPSLINKILQTIVKECM